MQIRINDLGCKVGDNNRLYSIGCTSILIEWMEQGKPLYRMLLDCGLKNTIDNFERKLDITNLSRIKNTMENKVPGFESGIQALALSHCHEDHVGGYPWFYQHCKDKGFPRNAIPKLYTTSMTWKQFVPFQHELYDIFEEPARNSEFYWDKGIINEIGSYIFTRDYYSDINVDPKPLDFEIKLRFIPAGHIVGSAMTEIDTIKQGESLGKILYTGDVCFRDGGFLVDPINQQIITDSYKAVIMEGTYIRNRPEPTEEAKKEGKPYKKLRRPQLMQILKEKIVNTMKIGGNVVLLTYGIDRTANVMVALREIIDEGIGIDLKSKIFLDTKIGSIITGQYKVEFESFIKFENPTDAYSYFRKELISRYNNGMGPSMLQTQKDKRDIYEYISGGDTRKDVIGKYRNGSCIVIATSATLEGGTALINGSYMHPDGWGSDNRHLFLIVGGAIPGIMASRALRQYNDEGKAEIMYRNYTDEAGERKWYNEKLIFSSKLEDLGEFSAHANHDELVAFKQRVNSEKFIITHIGGSNSPQSTQIYVNDIFMSGVGKYYKQGINLPIRGDIAILDGNNAVLINLNPDRKTLTLDNDTYNMLRIKCIKDKGDYGNVIACDVIRRLITEDDKRQTS